MFSVKWILSRHTGGPGGGAGVRASVIKWHMGERGSKIGQKSVTYYFNGPLLPKVLTIPIVVPAKFGERST